jgi:putative aldouronate transport system permease protein
MIQSHSLSHKLTVGSIYVVLTLMAILCMFPLINVLALSFSSNMAIEAGKVSLWPVDFSMSAYKFAAGKKEFVDSIVVSIQRVGLGLVINTVLMIITAYPLSKESTQFRARTWFSWFFVFTILFSGGLVPTYVIVNQLGLMDTLWALVLPSALPVFNVILLLNFIRGLPKELTEAAFMDGSGHWSLLMRIIVPLSLPAIATTTLFTIVGHWNDWFAGLIYMNSPKHYPLASYLQTVIIKLDFSDIHSDEQIKLLGTINNRSVRAAEIFLGSLPVFLVYPFLQRYFMTGIVMGSVKE